MNTKLNLSADPVVFAPVRASFLSWAKKLTMKMAEADQNDDTMQLADEYVQLAQTEFLPTQELDYDDGYESEDLLGPDPAGFLRDYINNHPDIDETQEF